MRNILKNSMGKIKSAYEYLTKRGVLFATWFGISNPWGSSAFTTLDGTALKVVDVLKFAVNVSGLVAVAVIVYGAYNLIISAGDEGKVEVGQKTIQAAVIGLVIIVLARLIIQFLIQTNILK